MDPESDMPYGSQVYNGEPVTINGGAWLGERCCILSGVTIGRKSIIGANSVVTKDIPDFCIAAGNPAKVIKHYDFNLHRWV
jgi:lipopolysaccharide O-acetyltransferase